MMLKKLSLGLLIGATLFSCSTETETQSPDVTESKSMKQEFYLGTYTDKDSEGIYKYALHEDGKLEKMGLAVKTENPSFLSHNGKYLLAVNENTEGSVESYRIEGDSLVFISKQNSGGAHPCFVKLNENGDVIIANYTGGNVSLLKMEEEGMLSQLLDVQQHEGSGPTDRQEAAHAHSAWYVEGTNEVLSVDLGTDEIYISEIDHSTSKLILKEQSIKMEAGAGPRHLSFHPNKKWIYVLNELNGSISRVVRTEEGNYELMETVPTLPADFESLNTCADIHISADGKFLYASNRGHDSIVMYAIGEDGALKQLGYESTRGATPRNFSISPDGKFLLVANQNGNNIVSFARDENSGMLSFAAEIEAPSPVCIMF